MAAKPKAKRTAYTAGLHSQPIIPKAGVPNSAVPSQFRGSPGGRDGWKSTHHPVKPAVRKK